MKYEYGGVDYEGDDFYCYPDSTVLINRFDIRDGNELEQVERDISYGKMLYLGKNPLKGVFDLKYLQKIHKFVFEDIYSWAGNIRGGQFFSKGNSEFCRAPMIHAYANNVFGKLRAENWLRGLDCQAFIERLAYFMGEINTLHPFREGNGRVQRLFFTELARRARYGLDFRVVDANELLDADISAYNKDYAPLVFLLSNMVGKL
jgi:cell filamentation protein